MAREQAPAFADVAVKVGPAGQMPLYATAGSAGCDLYAAQPLTLRPGETRLLSLDLVLALPPGVEAQIRPRSGLSLRTALRLPNAPGTIDSDYRDPVAVLMQNTFSMSDLAVRIACQPELAGELAAKYRCVTLEEYLQQQDPSRQAAAAAALLAAQLPALASQPLYVDERGELAGTIHIQPGERIAQMVFCRILRAKFRTHPDPESLGEDRGGGFGSTGR